MSNAASVLEQLEQSYYTFISLSANISIGATA